MREGGEYMKKVLNKNFAVSLLDSDYFKYIIAFFLLFFFRPLFFEQAAFRLFEVFFLRMLQISSFMIFVFYFFLMVKTREIAKELMLLVAYVMSLLISTIINGHSIGMFMTTTYPLLAISILLTICMKARPKDTLVGFSIILTTLLVLSFIVMLIQPLGFLPYMHFLRPRNQLAPFYVISAVIAILNRQIEPNPKTYRIEYLTLILSSLMIFHLRSGSNLVAWMLFLIGYAMLTLNISKENLIKRIFEAFRNKFRIQFVYLSYALFSIAVIFFDIQRFFSGFFENALNRNLTFSGRTYLWEISRALISQRPILGLGVDDSGGNILNVDEHPYFFWFPQGIEKSAHNQFIHTLLLGGFLTFLMVCLFMFISGRKLVIFKEKEITKIIILGILSILMVYFSEAMGFTDLFILLIIASQLDRVFEMINPTVEETFK